MKFSKRLILVYVALMLSSYLLVFGYLTAMIWFEFNSVVIAGYLTNRVFSDKALGNGQLFNGENK